jgi:hypothetical protein
MSALAQHYEKYIKSIDFTEINPSLEQAKQ